MFEVWVFDFGRIAYDDYYFPEDEIVGSLLVPEDVSGALEKMGYAHRELFSIFRPYQRV